MLQYGKMEVNVLDVLLIEDNEAIAKGLSYAFEKNKHGFSYVTTVEEANAYISKHKDIDLIILDIALPDGNGFDLYQNEIKSREIPTIFLTARDDEDDIVRGLDIGAEDYITKPFNIVELVERVKAVLRRTKADTNHFEFDDIRIEFDNRRVYKSGEEIPLKPREFDLLEVLVNNRNLALSREKLLHLVWEFDYEGDTRTVDVHIQRLRQKLGISDRIQTVYKTGYRFEI